MKVRGFWPEIITQNPECLRVLVRHCQAQNVFRSILNPSVKLLWNFKNFVFSRFFYWMTYLFTCLFTNHSSYSACIMVLLLYPFDLPFFSSQPCKVTIYGRHVMASVQDISLRHSSHYALLTMLWSEFDIAEIEAQWLSRIEVWGEHFMSIFSVFSVMAG